jgi:TRAP-type C4-dicarboxylate transport system substrate-binding protein
MKRIRFLNGILIIAAVFVFMFSTTVAPVHAADKVYKWKCQGFYPASSPSYQGSLLAVIEKIKERSGGRLVIEPFAASALVPSKDIFNAVKRGMIEMGVSSPGYFRSQVPLADVASGLCFAFTDIAECEYFHFVMGFEKMMQDACAKHGMLYFTDKIYATELVTTKPIRTAADFKGLKLRSSGSMQIFLSALGAAASYLPGSEVYPALSTGVVEGAHWGAASATKAMKLYEVCKYHLKPPINISGNDCWLINRKAFEQLPPDLQEIIYSTLREHVWKRSNEYKMEDAFALSEVQSKDGVTVTYLPPEEQKKMLVTAEKLWDQTAQKSPECATAVGMVKDLLKKLGRL